MNGKVMNRIALIDLDGTLADYDKAIRRDMELIRSPHEPPISGELVSFHKTNMPPYMKARAKMIRSQPGWWLNLEPLKYGFEVVELLKSYKFTLHVLTKAPHTVDGAWTEKVQWCKRYLPDTDITISQEKGLVYGKILFDDWPPYVVDWLKYRPRGLVIMIEHPWNKDFHHPQVIKYNGENLAEVESRIIKLIEAHETGLAGVTS